MEWAQGSDVVSRDNVLSCLGLETQKCVLCLVLCLGLMSCVLSCVLGLVSCVLSCVLDQCLDIFSRHKRRFYLKSLTLHRHRKPTLSSLRRVKSVSLNTRNL